MLWLRQVARGRAAESIGRRGLPADRLARTLDFAGLAQKDLRRLPARARRVLERYAAGVDARIAQIRDGGKRAPVDVARLLLPLDALGARRLPGDSQAAGLESRRLGRGESGAVGSDPASRSRRRRALLPRLRHLRGGRAARRPGVGCAPGPRLVAAGGCAAARSRLLRPRSRQQRVGARRRQRSASGHPILAGDLHLDPTVPAAFHLDHLRAGELEIAGATLAGCSALLVRPQPAGRVVRRRRARGRRRPLRRVDRSRRSRSIPRRRRLASARAPRRDASRCAAAAAQQLDVRSTGNGPLLPDLPGNPPLSVRWSGAQGGAGSGFASLLDVAHAADADSFREALREHREPMLAVAYADVKRSRRRQGRGLRPAPLAVVQAGAAARTRALVPMARARARSTACRPCRLEDARGLGGRGRCPARGPRRRRADRLAVAAAARARRASRRCSSRRRARAASGCARWPTCRPTSASSAAPRDRRAGDVAGGATGRSARRRPRSCACSRTGTDARRPTARARRRTTCSSASCSRRCSRSASVADAAGALPRAAADRSRAARARAARRRAGGGGAVSARVGARTAVARSLRRRPGCTLSYRLGRQRAALGLGRAAPAALPRARLRPGRDDPAGLGPFRYGGSSATVSAAPYDFAAPFEVTTASTLASRHRPRRAGAGARGDRAGPVGASGARAPRRRPRPLARRAAPGCSRPTRCSSRTASVARLDLEPVR